MSEAYSANCKEMEMGVDNLDELLGQDFMDNLLEVAVENSTVDGEFVYMPWQNNTTAMVYRKDLFEELDRKKAIKLALETAKKGDIVLILGKGHEKTILRADGPHEFEDAKVTRTFLKAKK